MKGITIIIIGLAVTTLEWLATCGVYKLVTLCFGWTFTWPVATGVWLCAKLLRLSVTVRRD